MDNKARQVPATVDQSSTPNNPGPPRVIRNKGLRTAANDHEAGKRKNGDNKHLAKITKIVRKITRNELEEMMLEKVVECVMANGQLAVLHQKIKELTLFAARLVEKEKVLNEQVSI